MNRYTIISIILFIIGIIFFILGFLSEELEVGIFLIFPFIIGSGIYVLTGFLLIFIAIIIYLFGFSAYIQKIDKSHMEIVKDDFNKKKSVKAGGVILIGPIPIVFGSNWKITVLLIILALTIILLSMTFMKIF